MEKSPRKVEKPSLLVQTKLHFSLITEKMWLLSLICGKNSTNFPNAPIITADKPTILFNLNLLKCKVLRITKMVISIHFQIVININYIAFFCTRLITVYIAASQFLLSFFDYLFFVSVWNAVWTHFKLSCVYSLSAQRS